MSAESIPVYSRSCFQFVKSASKIRHCVRARARNPSTSAATSNFALQRKLQSFYKLPTTPPGLNCIVKVERKSSDQARFGISEEYMSPTGAQTENILLIVIVQLIIIVAASRFFGGLFRRMGQPLVCGEIAAGLILGPSFFGGMFPHLFHRVFDPSVGQIFSMMSQIGLILLMFLIGLEFDFGHLSNNRGTALSISLAGIILPFSLGFLLGRWMHAVLHMNGGWLNLALFMAAAMSITAIPILGRIMIELNLTRTRIGSLTISAAAADDASGWIILALVTAIARSTLNPVNPDCAQ